MLPLAKECDSRFRPVRGARKKFPWRGVGSSGGSGSCDCLKQRTHQMKRDKQETQEYTRHEARNK